MILLLDDEGEYVDNIIAELRALGLEVNFVSTVDAALAFIEQDLSRLSAIVCDVMMPHGQAFTGLSSNDSLTTGISFAQKVREKGLTLPIVFLTNLESGRFSIEEMESIVAPCSIIRKREKWSFEIAEMIRDIVSGKEAEG